MFQFGNYPLRLRFINGEEGGGAEPVVEPVESAPAEPAGNPAWDTLRSELDEISFHRIEPHLKEMDRAAQQRVTASNQQLAPYKEFIDSGVTPEDMQTGLALAQRVNSNPEELYEALGTYLRDNGRLPNEVELKQEIKDNAEEAEQQEPNSDPRIDELAQQTQQMREFLQAQEFERQVSVESQSLAQEEAALKAANPYLTDADIRTIQQQAVSIAQTTGKVPSITEVHDGWFSELRTRFLSTPRPGDSAPKLLPTNGGVPSSVPQKSLGALSSAETQDMIASLIEANRG
jgi:hypothetical protein